MKEDREIEEIMQEWKVLRKTGRMELWQKLSKDRRKKLFLLLEDSRKMEILRMGFPKEVIEYLHQEDSWILFEIKRDCFKQYYFYKCARKYGEIITKAMSFPQLEKLREALKPKNNPIGFSKKEEDTVAYWYLEVDKMIHQQKV